MRFSGFPVAALDFYDDLEMDNTKAYWEKHKPVYDEAVKAPMAELVAALADVLAAKGVVGAEIVIANGVITIRKRAQAD